MARERYEAARAFRGITRAWGGCGRLVLAGYVVHRAQSRRIIFLACRVQPSAMARPFSDCRIFAGRSDGVVRAHLRQNLCRGGRWQAADEFAVRCEYSLLYDDGAGTANKKPLAVDEAFGATTASPYSVAKREFDSQKPSRPQIRRNGRFAQKRGTSVRTRELSLVLRCARCSSVRREARAHSESPRPSREFEPNANGNASCLPPRAAVAVRRGVCRRHRYCGIPDARAWFCGRGISLTDGNKRVRGGASGSRSGECSASEFRSGLSARRQSRIQRANRASTSASAHLSRTSCASLRRRARRFRCASSNDSRAGLEAVTRNSSCGLADTMTDPPNSDPQREGGTETAIRVAHTITSS